MRPLIGVTAFTAQAAWGPWRAAACLAPAAYVTRLRQAGGRAVLLPPTTEDASDLVTRLDGVLFTGGTDIGPERYGALPDPRTGSVDVARDTGELALLGAALQHRAPVLGVCRGMQLLVVATGGTLVQHLPDIVGDDRHRRQEAGYDDHPVRVAPASQLAQVVGERVAVASHHHQGVATLGPAVTPAAWADDGTVEAVELADRPFTIGVLWHPEVRDDLTLFRAFVEACA